MPANPRPAGTLTQTQIHGYGQTTTRRQQNTPHRCALLLNKTKMWSIQTPTASPICLAYHLWTLLSLALITFNTLQSFKLQRPTMHQRSHLIIASSCFLFFWSRPDSCFLVLPVSHLSFLPQTLSQNNKAVVQEATSRMEREADGGILISNHLTASWFFNQTFPL